MKLLKVSHFSDIVYAKILLIVTKGCEVERGGHLPEILSKINLIFFFFFYAKLNT